MSTTFPVYLANHYKTVKAYSPNIAQDKYRLNMTACGAPLKIGNDYDFVRYVEKRVIKDKISPSFSFVFC